MATYEIINAEAACSAVRDQIDMDVEEFWAVALGPAKDLLQSRMIFRGTVDACLVHPREIFRFAFLANASSMIVIHNHPSGDPQPSDQDLLFTQQLFAASEILDLPIDDHLIMTANGFLSFAREGILPTRRSLRHTRSRR